MRSKHVLEPGYVLNTRPYQDSSLLVEIFTRQHGRVALVARGVRGPKSRLRALLQPLQPLLLSWSQSGEMGTLTTVESAGVAPVIVGERVFYGWYLNELLLKLTQRHDAHPALFDQYVLSVGRLETAAAEAALRIFELHLLAELGYGLQWPEPLDADQHYAVSSGREPIAVSASRDSVLGASLQALREERLDTPQALRDAQRVLKRALHVPLAGKTLETPAMLRALRAKMKS